MTEWIGQVVSTTIFLSLILLLRAVFCNRISKRVCYAMWLVVGVYLLASFGEFSNPFQILNVIYRAAGVENGSEVWNQEQRYSSVDIDDDMQAEEWNRAQNDTAAFEQENQAADYQEQGQMEHTDDTNWNTAASTALSGIGQENDGKMQEQLTTKAWIKELWMKELWTKEPQPEGVWMRRIWTAGCVSCVLAFAGSNLHFAKRLRKSRKRMETGRGFRKMTGRGYILAYQTGEISTPCLFGAVRPAIYLPLTQMEPEKCGYVLAHEYTHYRHGDHIWAMVRCLCISLYWYHPLVWLAALLSGRDSELACDESVIRTYDATERRAYGETLILFGTGGRERMRLFTGASGMNGGDQELKKRITLIASQGKQRVGTAALACVLLLGVTGCTIGSPAAESDNDPNENISAAAYDFPTGQESGNDENSGHIEEATQAESGEISTEANKDRVPEPYDFARFLEKTEENGIAYYNVITEKDMPLPLDEWAKINIFTEKGNAVDAYVRFTQVIRDTDEIKAHIDHYFETREIREPFGMLETGREQCVLLQYEILIAGDASLAEDDRIPSMALDYPLQPYSTMESGRFATQGIERSVCDLSIPEQDKIAPGDTVRKEVICYIPKGSTAYGIELAYMTAQRTTGLVYFKPEYE